jgi:hypothetical protein
MIFNVFAGEFKYFLISHSLSLSLVVQFLSNSNFSSHKVVSKKAEADLCIAIKQEYNLYVSGEGGPSLMKKSVSWVSPHSKNPSRHGNLSLSRV